MSCKLTRNSTSSPKCFVKVCNINSLLFVLGLIFLFLHQAVGQQIVVSNIDFDSDNFNKNELYISTDNVIQTGVAPGEIKPLLPWDDGKTQTLAQFESKYQYVVAKDPSKILPNKYKAYDDYMFIVSPAPEGRSTPMLQYNVSDLAPRTVTTTAITVCAIVDPTLTTVCQGQPAGFKIQIGDNTSQGSRDDDITVTAGTCKTTTYNTPTANANGVLNINIIGNRGGNCAALGISKIEVRGTIAPQALSIQGPEVCAGEQISLQPKGNYKGTYQWQVDDGSGFKNFGTTNSPVQSYETKNVQNYKFRFQITPQGGGVITSDVIDVNAIKCCTGPGGSASSRQTIYYDDFGTLDLAADPTGKTYKVWDYTTDPENPKQVPKTTTTPFRWPLAQPPIGAKYIGAQGDPIVDGEYTVASYITNTTPYNGIRGADLKWAGLVTGPASNPPIAYDHSGKVEGAALFLNNPFNSKGSVVYKKDITNLCTTNGKTIFFECYIAVFTISPNGVNVTLRLTGGDAPVEISGVATKEGVPNTRPDGTTVPGGKWVRIAGSVVLTGNTLTMEVINNAPNEWNSAGNDLVIDDIRIQACAPPPIELVYNKTTLIKDTILCKDRSIISLPTDNLKKYYNNTPQYLYQWTTKVDDYTSWLNVPGGGPSTSENFVIPDIKALSPTLKEGDKVYFRVVAALPASFADRNNFIGAGNYANINSACRNYSVSVPVEGTIQCPSCNKPTSVTTTSTPALANGQPKTVTICEGSTATLSGAYVVGTKAPNPLNSYKFSWYKKGANPAPAALGADPKPIADKALNPVDSGTWVLRVEDSDASGSPASSACYTEDSIKLVVLKKIADNVIQSDQTICSGSSADSLIQKKGTTIKGNLASPGFKWVSSTNKNTGYADAGSSESFYFKTTGLNTTTYFKRIALAQAGLCLNDSSLPVTITVVPPITDNKINSDTLICGGNAPAIKGSAVANETLYLWQDSSATTGKWTDIPNSNTRDLPTGRTLINTDPAKNVFSYYRRIAKVGTCTSISNTITVTVTAGIDPGKIGTNQTICSGATPVKLTSLATAVGGSVSPIKYIWLTSPDGVTYTEEGTADAANTEHPFTNALTANLFLKRRAIGGTNVCDAGNTEPVQITVVKPPVANILAPKTITSPDSANETFNQLPENITAKATDPGYKGIWAIISTVPSTPAVTLGSPVISIANTVKEMAFDQKAVVTWTVTDSGKVCPAAIAKLILERKNFTKASVQDKEMCVTTLPVPYVLDGNGLIGEETSKWTYLGSIPAVPTKPTLVADSVDPTNRRVTGFEIPPNAGKVKFNFLYEVVSTLGGNTQDTASITVWEKSQEANITPAAEETCKDNIALTGTKPLQPEAKGIWKVNSGADISQFSDLNVNTATLKRIAEPKEKYLLGGTVSLTWSITNGMCPPTEKTGTYVFRPTQKVEAKITGDSVLCLPKDSSTFTAATANGGPLSKYAFEVTHADGTKGKTQASSVTNTFKVNPNDLKDLDKINVSIEPDTSAGCFVGLGSATIGIDGYVYPDTLLLPSDDTACVGEKVRICLANQTKVKGWESYQWYKGTTEVPSETNVCIELKTPEQSGDYVLVTHTTQCGPHASVVRPVKIYHQPLVSFDPDEMVFALVDLDSTVVLQPIIKNAPPDSLYYQKWSKVSGKDLTKDPVLPLSSGDKDTLTPVFRSPANGGTFIYSLKVSTFDNAKHHCADSAEVTVIALPSIRVPNVFSPNGDGSNDKWYIYGLENYAHAKVSIFNRLGNRLMEISPYTPESAWDGTMNGSGEVPVGTYYYVVDLIKSAGSLPRTYTGNVTIVR